MLLLPAVLLAVAPPPAPFDFPDGTHAHGSLRHVGGVPVLTVSGTPEQMGRAAGALALKHAPRVLGYPRDLLRLRKVDFLWGTLAGQGRTMYREFPADYRDELEAMTAAAAAPRDLVVAGNTFFDVKKVFACSAVGVEASRSATRGPLLARNLDYPSLGWIHEYSLVTVYRPKDKLAFAGVGFPGLVGVLSGMNEAGLCVGVLEAFDVKAGVKAFDGKGLPYALCLRRMLEEAKTVAEAKAVLEKLRRTSLILVAVADRDGVGVLEVSPDKVVLRRATDGVCPTANHYLSDELRAEKPADVNWTFERLARLEKLRRWEKPVTVDDLRDRLHATHLGSLTLQAMVFEPRAMRLHLGVGRAPATAVAFRALDVGKLLKADRP